MSEPRPSLEDISYAGEMLDILHRDSDLSPELFYAIMVLVTACAAARVWTYTEPDPAGWFHVSDGTMHFACHLSAKKWKAARPFFEKYFEIVDGRWRLKEPWILVDGVASKRPLIPAWMRTEVMVRDDYRCGYCGTRVGPFDCDHIIPVIQGGATVPENLLCACQKCNRSKGARTPEEWLA